MSSWRSEQRAMLPKSARDEERAVRSEQRAVLPKSARDEERAANTDNYHETIYWYISKGVYPSCLFAAFTKQQRKDYSTMAGYVSVNSSLYVSVAIILILLSVPFLQPLHLLRYSSPSFYYILCRLGSNSAVTFSNTF